MMFHVSFEYQICTFQTTFLWKLAYFIFVFIMKTCSYSVSFFSRTFYSLVSHAARWECYKMMMLMNNYLYDVWLPVLNLKD